MLEAVVCSMYIVLWCALYMVGSKYVAVCLWWLMNLLPVFDWPISDCSVFGFIPGCRRIHFWRAPLGVHRHQSPEWTILSLTNCFIQSEVLILRISLLGWHVQTLSLARKAKLFLCNCFSTVYIVSLYTVQWLCHFSGITSSSQTWVKMLCQALSATM